MTLRQVKRHSLDGIVCAIPVWKEGDTFCDWRTIHTDCSKLGHWNQDEVQFMPFSNITHFLLTFWPLRLFLYTYSIRFVSNINTEVQGYEFQAIFFFNCDFVVFCLRLLDNFTGWKYRNFQSELQRTINIRIKTGDIIFNVSLNKNESVKFASKEQPEIPFVVPTDGYWSSIEGRRRDSTTVVLKYLRVKQNLLHKSRVFTHNAKMLRYRIK